eukprot:PhF_6_TR22684/c0_g1_i1/m.32297
MLKAFQLQAPQDNDMVDRFMKIMNTVVAPKVVHKGSAVVFGSRATNLSVHNSDVDVAIVWKNFKPRDNFEEHAKKILDRLRHTLYHTEGIRNVILIPAVVPIITCYFEGQLTCEITIQPYVVNALENTKIIRYVVEAIPQFPALVFGLKQWTIENDLYGSKRSMFSTFVLVLLIMYALQIASVPLLTPDQPVPITPQPATGLSVEMLFFEVLEILSGLRYNECVVSLYGRCTRDSYVSFLKTLGKPKLITPSFVDTPMVVEDVASGENCARRLSPRTVESFSKALKKTVEKARPHVNDPDKFWEAVVPSACASGGDGHSGELPSKKLKC